MSSEKYRIKKCRALCFLKVKIYRPSFRSESRLGRFFTSVSLRTERIACAFFVSFDKNFTARKRASQNFRLSPFILKNLFEIAHYAPLPQTTLTLL